MKPAKARVKSLKAIIGSLNRTLVSQDWEIQGLKQELAATLSNESELRYELSQSEGTVLKLGTWNDEASHIINNYEQVNARLRERISELRAELTNAKWIDEESREEIERLRDRARGKRMDSYTLMGKQAEIAELKADNRELEAFLDNAEFKSKMLLEALNASSEIEFEFEEKEA